MSLDSCCEIGMDMMICGSFCGYFVGLLFLQDSGLICISVVNLVPSRYGMSKCCLDLVKKTCYSCMLGIMILHLKSVSAVLFSCFSPQFRNRKHILTFSDVINMPLLNLVITPTWEDFVNVGKNFHLSWHNAFFPLLKYWNS